jgi:hypothetical protein
MPCLAVALPLGLPQLAHARQNVLKVETFDVDCAVAVLFPGLLYYAISSRKDW